MSVQKMMLCGIPQNTSAAWHSDWKHTRIHTYEALLYGHGTHSVFPQSLLKIMLPVVSGAMVRVFRAGRQHPKECKQTRIYIDRRIAASLTAW